MEIRRPLKRPKLGPPDIYPQDPKQKEDELTSVNVKQGYTSAPLVSGPNNLDEFGTAKHANIDAFGVYFSALLSEKHRINTLNDTQKKKQLVNTKEIWYVHAKTKHSVDNWFRDLANGTKSLGQLGKRIPIFNSKEGMFSQLYESHVPFAKAVWFTKMSAVHAIALSESGSKSKKRQVPDQYQELTAALTKYLKEIFNKLFEFQNIPEDFIPIYNQWQYQTQLARYLFDEGLLDQYDFLCFPLELIEKKRPINDLFVKIICPFVLEYVIDFSRSAVLSRRLAHVCAKKLCHTLHHHPMSAKLIRKNDLSNNSNNPNNNTNYSANISIAPINANQSSQSNTQTQSSQQPQQQLPQQYHQRLTSTNSSISSFGFLDNPLDRFDLNQKLLTRDQQQTHHYINRIFDTRPSTLLQNPSSSINQSYLIANSIIDIVKAQIIESQFVESSNVDQENGENIMHKNAIYILSAILQVICIECPTAMVRHHIVEAKFSPMFQGSPLDHLPCLPSNLPMMESDLNFELRKTIHDAEREILCRSTMADLKWSCDNSSRMNFSKNNLVNRLLSVMDVLDKHDFDKVDTVNSIDILYSKIFSPIEMSSKNKSFSGSSTHNQINQSPLENFTSNQISDSGILDLSSTSSGFNQSSISDGNKKLKHPLQIPNMNSSNTNSLQSNTGSELINYYEDHVVKLLCEWATTTQRTGEHRALVVARILERRQNELQEWTQLSDRKTNNCSSKQIKSLDDSKPQQTTDINVAPINSPKADSLPVENNTEQTEEIIQYSFQYVLVQFLDENAPVIDESQNDDIDNKKAFNNLVLLFSELIRCDVFSHYNYMCTLISRGMFIDLSKSSSANADANSIDSPGPNSNLNQPGSVKPPKPKESDSILANTILSGNTNIYPLTVSTNPVNQSNHLDPLTVNKSNSADQSLRSLGFSPVSSQNNVSQSLDKGQGLLDNHIDDVDADLGKILQDIKEGQQDEAADILLPDYLGGSGSLREDSSHKTTQLNKLSPFNLGDNRTTSLDSSAQASSNVISNNNFANSVDSKPQINFTSDDKSSNINSSEYRHMTFVKHFPVPDDESFARDINQRNILLYGFGKEREEARHTMKKLIKEINKLFGRRASRDISDGGKIKKLAAREGFNAESALHKFETQLNYHDQHVITNSLSMTILEMFSGVSNGQTFLLPTLEAISFAFDLFTIASNVSGMLELIIPLLEELPDVEEQIKMKCPQMISVYTNSIAIYIIGMLYRYHTSVLLLSKDELCSIFESLHKLSSLSGPNLCSTSAERVIFGYLYDLYSAQTGRYFDQFFGMIQKCKQVLQGSSMTHPTNLEFDWTPTFLINIVNSLHGSPLCSNSSTNPVLNASAGGQTITMNFSHLGTNDLVSSIRQQLYLIDSPATRQLNESPGARYRFVCDAIYLSATATYTDLVNDIAVLCADITAKCPSLTNDWILALQALCCSSNRDHIYRQLLTKVNISEYQVMNNIAIFLAILVARRCIELNDFIIKCAIGAILAPLTQSDKQPTEPGVRLTCHLLLALFRNRDSSTAIVKSNQIPSYNAFGQTFQGFDGGGGFNLGLLSAVPHISLLQPFDGGPKAQLNLKYLCDYNLLRSACCSIKTECHITLLKAIRLLAISTSPGQDLDSQGRVKIENHFDDISMDGLSHIAKDLNNHDNSPGLMGTDSNYNLKHINLQTASLHQFADAILRLLCSQRWLHDKCLADSEVFTTTDQDENILLDPRLDVKQSQRLLYMICYNKSPEKQADIGLDDQGSDQVASIVKMFENLDVWSMRLSLMRLQFMYAYCKSQSNVMLNDWLDNLAKAVVEFFQKFSQENDNEKELDDSSNSSSKKMKSSQFNSVVDINKVWLIEPLLDKLAKPPSAIQSKIIKASAALMESASVRANSLPSLNQTYLSTAAASTKFKERTLSQRGSASTNPSNLASTSLLGFQPFLSLLLSCLRNQDKERETLLTSLNSQLYQAIHEKVDDIGYKQSIQDGLELRLCLIGQMFDTIQKSSNLTSDWATLLLLLIMNNLVDPQVDYGLYVSVLDMLAMLIHSAYASDPIEQKEDAKKQYQNLMKKFRKELTALEEKGFLQMKLINPLMPLVRQMTEVITCEPMGSLVDTKGEKVENFYSIDKKKGLKVSELQEVSPWDLIEGHKNPAPLSWPWFGAIRLEHKPLRADENNRLMSWHTHTLRHSTAYFCQGPTVDDGPASSKRSNTDKKPSQNNPLLKSLIEANDDVSASLCKKESDSITKKSQDDDILLVETEEDYYISRADLLEDYCELPVDLLFDSAPIETMIEDIKTAMQAEHAALSNKAAKTASQALESTSGNSAVTSNRSLINSSNNSQSASSILAPVQSNEPIRSTTPQLSALSALQSVLNSSNPGLDSATSILPSPSGPASVPPPPMSMSPVVNPLTPELIPARSHSNVMKIAPVPSPAISSVASRSMSPMVVRSPAVVPTPPPPKTTRAPRKKRVTKKDAAANALAMANNPNTVVMANNLNAVGMNTGMSNVNMSNNPNAIIMDANANLQPTIINKNMMQPMNVAPYQAGPRQMDTMSHAAPPMMVNQMQPLNQPNQDVLVHRLPLNQPPQQQAPPQASVYDFQPYQQQQPQQQPQLSMTMHSQHQHQIQHQHSVQHQHSHTHQHQHAHQQQASQQQPQQPTQHQAQPHHQHQPPQQQPQQRQHPHQHQQPHPHPHSHPHQQPHTHSHPHTHPQPQAQQQQPHPHTHPHQQQHQHQHPHQHHQHPHQHSHQHAHQHQHQHQHPHQHQQAIPHQMQAAPQQQSVNQHHPIQYTPQHSNQQQQQQQSQQHPQMPFIRMVGHQQQSPAFQQVQSHQQHTAGHARPALTAMLHQKHAAAGNMDKISNQFGRFQ